MGSCWQHGALIGPGLRMRVVVSLGSHTNPDGRDTESSSFPATLQAIMQAVLDTAHSLCPAVVQKSGVRDQLVNAMSERIYLQDHLNLSTVLDQMVTDIFSKLKWVTRCSSFSSAPGTYPWGQMGIWGGPTQLLPSPHRCWWCPGSCGCLLPAVALLPSWLGLGCVPGELGSPTG